MHPPQAHPNPQSKGLGRLPQAWHIYQSGWTRKFEIGEHQNAPHFAVISHTGWFGRPRLTLHSGAGSKSDVVATVKKPPSGNKHGFRVIIPSAETSEGGEAPSDHVVDVEAHSPAGPSQKFHHRTYRFSVRPGSGWRRRSETFEWRHAHGEAIEQVCEDTADEALRKGLDQIERGWTLVRLDPGMGFRPGYGWGHKEEEVVAVWGETSTSRDKKASFALLGSGATGELGGRFANMAVITGMALWDEEQRQRQAKSGA